MNEWSDHHEGLIVLSFIVILCFVMWGAEKFGGWLGERSNRKHGGPLRQPPAPQAPSLQELEERLADLLRELAEVRAAKRTLALGKKLFG